MVVDVTQKGVYSAYIHVESFLFESTPLDMLRSLNTIALSSGLAPLKGIAKCIKVFSG